MKLIGIINKWGKSFNNYDIGYNYLDISKRIIEAGGYPIGINLLGYNLLETKQFLNNINGIILQGGDDYTKDELEIVKYAYKKDIPTLGICLGMQTMAVAFNGTLEEIKNHNKTVHQVTLNKNSKIYQILKKENIIVNSRHNFKVGKTNLNVTGKHNDTIEIIEDTNKIFFIGVQWHPESLNNEDTKKLFDYFVNVRDNNDFV